MPLQAKYKKIPALYYVVYFIGTFNVFLGSFIAFYFDTLSYFKDSFANYFLILLIIIYLIRLVKKSNTIISLALDEEEINNTKLWWALMLKLFLTTSFVAFINTPYLERHYNLSKTISNFIIEAIPTISLEVVKILTDLTKFILNVCGAWIIAILQGIIGSMLYDFIIKPKIEAKSKSDKRKKSKKQKTINKP